MKTLKALLIVLFSPLYLFSQELTGLWSGTLENDSTKKKQDYELALSEYRGKVTGYSYTTFISNDTFYYSIKRLKATRIDTVWIVEDDKMVANNFPEKAAKGVRQINTFRLNRNDSSWKMDGTWKTTETKKYYALTGTMKMKEEADLKKSSLIAHLEELNLQNTVAFYQPDKIYFQDKKPEAILAKNEDQPAKKSIVQPDKSKDLAVRSNNILIETQKKETTQPAVKNEEILISKPERQANDQSIKTRDLAEIKNKPTITQEPKNQIIKPTIEKNVPVAKTIPAKKEVGSPDNKEPVKILPERQKKVETSTVSTPKVENKIPPVEKKETISIPARKEEIINVISSLPTVVANRKSETIQSIFFKSDSLLLSLYDNGVVDGDTVSVFLNGQNIVDKEKLKAVATKKTIYIPAKADSMLLVLFAENLGSIPPNTGLLVIRDGDEIYHVRFSADMQKNAAVMFRRKSEITNGR